jgi:hypothetical protein
VIEEQNDKKMPLKEEERDRTGDARDLGIELGQNAIDAVHNLAGGELGRHCG